MEIEQLVKEKKDLEKDLLEIIQSRVSEFNKNSVFMINDINVYFSSIQSLGEKNSVSLVTRVKCLGNFVE